MEVKQAVEHFAVTWGSICSAAAFVVFVSVEAYLQIRSKLREIRNPTGKTNGPDEKIGR